MVDPDQSKSEVDEPRPGRLTSEARRFTGDTARRERGGMLNIRRENAADETARRNQRAQLLRTKNKNRRVT